MLTNSYTGSNLFQTSDSVKNSATLSDMMIVQNLSATTTD